MVRYSINAEFWNCTIRNIKQKCVILLVEMEIEVYGFKAKITKEGKYLIGEIPELHIADQAKTLNELENELKDAVSLVVNLILDDPKDASKSFSAAVIRRLSIQVIHA
jgi:predicted RNA binding protein YcfA (HicA-like mRNA interferase family)/predicted RNase H-like HicB family nuclease